MNDTTNEMDTVTAAELSWARRALLVAGVLGVSASVHPLIVATGPIDILTPWEWVTLLLTGVFSATTGVASLLQGGRYIRLAGLVFSLWLAFHFSTNIANALLFSPHRESALIYTA